MGSVRQRNVFFVVIIELFYAGGRGGRVKLQFFKKCFPVLPIVGVVGGHAETSFLLPVRTLSGIQPELINPNGNPNYPGCNGTGGGLAGGKQRRVTPPPPRYTPPPSQVPPLHAHNRSHCVTLKQ